MFVNKATIALWCMTASSVAAFSPGKLDAVIASWFLYANDLMCSLGLFGSNRLTVFSCTGTYARISEI